jgi:putative two-component system response regulator
MKKILIVDDSEFHLDLAESILNQKYQIITAKSGNEALAHLSKGFIPNLILLDVIMPEMDGWDVYNLIRGISILGDVPIVFFTSLDNEDDKNRAFDLGAVDFITKPFEREEFLQRVDSILDAH